jgi:hypothetical protein
MFTENLSETQKELSRKRLQKDQALLDSIKSKLPSLEGLVFPFNVDYEDGVYRFYHNSFKVYYLQDLTVKAVDIFENIAKATNDEVCHWFKQIVADGTGKKWDADHNRDWLLQTRPIVEAFLHTKYFLDMMIKYGRELDSPPSILPFGWAAILELYNQR